MDFRRNRAALLSGTVFPVCARQKTGDWGTNAGYRNNQEIVLTGIIFLSDVRETSGLGLRCLYVSDVNMDTCSYRRGTQAAIAQLTCPGLS